MGDLSLQSRVRRSLLLALPAALGARLLPGQVAPSPPPLPDEDTDVRLPNGKSQRDEIAKADYEKNVKDARELVSTATSFEEELEKDDRYVLSVSSLKKLDDIEKLTRRLRGRLKRI